MSQSENVFHSDIVIVGAGITGVSLARELSRYDVSVTVVDRAADVAEGAPWHKKSIFQCARCRNVSRPV